MGSQRRLLENDALRPAFESAGEETVRAGLDSGVYQGGYAQAARLWLREIEAEREEHARRMAQEATERAVSIAERSATASERAARAAENAALYTRAAAWGSAVAAIVALAVAVLK